VERKTFRKLRSNYTSTDIIGILMPHETSTDIILSHEVANLEILAYNKRKQRIIKKIHKKRKSKIGGNAACIIE
jgi:hypothetical protein